MIILIIWEVHSLAALVLDEDLLELLEAEDTVSLDVVLSDHFLDFVARDLLTKLLHGQVNVFLSDLSRIVSVELLEDRLHFLLGHECTYINRGGKELTVIDLSVSMIVDLLDHLIYLSL